MRIIEGFNQFHSGKKYFEKITPDEFKSIPVGSEVKYLGAPCKVEKNNGYVLTLVPNDGDPKFIVNLRQFMHGGFIIDNK